MYESTLPVPGTGTNPPAKPPFWRRRWVQITGGISLALVALIAIGSATSHPNAAAPKASPSTSAPANPANP